jgi:hypothetical protein
MAFNEFELRKYQQILDKFIEKIRPPENIRKELDISYKITNQSVEIYEIRPQYDNPKDILNIEIAKATYVKTQDIWKIFWMRSDLKWHGYEPNPEVDDLSDFLSIIDEDKYGCFWG